MYYIYTDICAGMCAHINSYVCWYMCIISIRPNKWFLNSAFSCDCKWAKRAKFLFMVMYYRRSRQESNFSKIFKKKIEIHFYRYFKTRLIIQNIDSIVTLFDSSYLNNLKKIFKNVIISNTESSYFQSGRAWRSWILFKRSKFSIFLCCKNLTFERFLKTSELLGWVKTITKSSAHFSCGQIIKKRN